MRESFEQMGTQDPSKEQQEKQERIKEVIKLNISRAAEAMKEGGRYPRNPEWWSDMIRSLDIVEKYQSIGNFGDDALIYPTGSQEDGQSPSCFQEILYDENGNPVSDVWQLNNAVIIGNDGIQEVTLNNPPVGWESPEGASGIAHPPSN